ncbi:MAG: hypothetical protein IJP96_08085, partial [Synergistaceae bacterium]|nr:hypothetical protein [Synergistaceae bacterium]
VHAGDEMLYLKCERMFSVQDDIEGKSFSFQELGENVWSSTQYYQDNILELHFELDTKNNILDLYVLASGGKNGKTNNPPQNWPSKARWKDEYKYNVMYVSHASWKLDNIPDNFDWFDKN